MLTRIPFVLGLALLPVEVLGKDANPTKVSQACFYGIYDAMQDMTWVESSNSSKVSKRSTSAPECTNLNTTLSIYASCEHYCSESDMATGIVFWKKLCKAKKATLTDISTLSATVNEAYIQELPLADPELNKTTKMTSPVLLTSSYYERSYLSWKYKIKASPRSQYLGWGLIGYWGLVVFLGILGNLIQTLSSSRLLSRRGDVESAGASPKALELFAPLATAIFLFKTHIVVPAAFGTHHQRLWNWCTVPRRLEMIFVAVWWALCVIFCCVGYYTVPGGNTITPNVHRYLWNLVAVRAGYLAYSCLAWLWIFAQRNNIFIWATGWTFRTFTIFHRHCARAATIFAVIHSIAYTVDYGHFRHTYHDELPQTWFRAGIVATILMCLLVTLAASWFRVKFYDTFLLIHITFCVILVVMLFTHSSKFTDGKYNPYLWPLVAIWSFDRLLRLTRIAYCNLRARLSSSILRTTSTTVRYSPASDVLRIDVQVSSPTRLRPGQHYFIYQPLALRGWESHPFSLGSWSTTTTTTTTTTATDSPSPSPSPSAAPTATDPEKHAATATTTTATTTPQTTDSTTLTFLVRPHSGWTHRLRALCLAAPAHVVRPRLLLEGPYGADRAPRLLRGFFDAAVFVAGGTGVAAVAPYAVACARRGGGGGGGERTMDVRLVWACRRGAEVGEVMGAFGGLRDVVRSGGLGMEVYVTGEEEGEGEEDGGSGSEEEEEEEERAKGKEGEEEVIGVARDRRDGGADGRRQQRRGGAAAAGLGSFRRGRPDVRRVVADAAREAAASGARVALFVCGPPAMADEARAAVHKEMREGCRGIEYFEECYGW